MRDGGAYTLIIYLRSPVKVHVGALGTSDFPRGYHIYVGSALRGIKERVARHLRHVKRPHWHVDYLPASEEARVTSALTAETDERMECKISASIGDIRGAKVILEGFAPATAATVGATYTTLPSDNTLSWWRRKGDISRHRSRAPTHRQH